jgi:hypothetical protein
VEVSRFLFVSDPETLDAVLGTRSFSHARSNAWELEVHISRRTLRTRSSVAECMASKRVDCAVVGLVGLALGLGLEAGGGVLLLTIDEMSIVNDDYWVVASK